MVDVAVASVQVEQLNGVPFSVRVLVLNGKDLRWTITQRHGLSHAPVGSDV